MDNEIKSFLDVIQEAVVAAQNKAPPMPRSTAHSEKDRKDWEKAVEAHQKKQEELGVAAVQAAFALGGLFLSDMRRIADSLETIARSQADDNLFRGK